MNVVSRILQSILLTSALAVLPATAELEEMSLSQLEQHLATIDSELEQLASFTTRSGTGAMGYRSRNHSQPDEEEWIRIELGEEVAIDQVVLVPTLYRDLEPDLQSGGFPVAFQILAGTAKATNVVASFTAEDQLLPRIAPLTVPFPAVKASWVGIKATTLSLVPNVPNRYTLQFSELLVFSGMENVAHRRHVTVPFPARDFSHPQHERFLTDGFTPFVMNAAQGSSSQSRRIRVKSPYPAPTLTLDLSASQPIHQINLHTADVSLSVPMARFSCWAVPRHIRITGANRADFADETFLFEYEQTSIYDSGPMIMRGFPEMSCRYIRLTILNPHSVVSFNETELRIAFSEIEVLSKNQNIAQGAPVTTSSGLACSRDTLVRMTDGLNYYGAILPIREWMEQLSRRHDLETERPIVSAALATRYARHQTKLRLMIGLSTLLATGILATILIDRLLRRRQVARIRGRFAADLHDELGADLHTIGLLSDLASEATDNPEKLNHLLQEIRTATEEAGTAVRHCSNMQELRNPYADLPEELRRGAERILVDQEHEFTVGGTAYLRRLPARIRSDLFLFYKECLINICKHSGATQLNTRLTATRKEILLTVTDNGCGLTSSNNSKVPRSLKRRARLMGARISATIPPSGGTSITLRLRR